MNPIDQITQKKFAAPDLALKPFDPLTATDVDLTALNAIFNRHKREEHPNDPPTPLEEMVQSLRSLPDFVEVHAWAVWQGDAIVAHAATFFIHQETNQHLAQLEMYVVPEWRRKGIATELMGLVAQAAGSGNRRLILARTDSSIPAGEAFMTWLGADMGLVESLSELDLTKLDRDLLRRWRGRLAERGQGFEMGVWVGPYPAAELEAIALLKRTMNSAPRDNLDVEDFEWTAEQIRLFDERDAARGVERWSMYTRDEASGEYVGFTEVFWRASEPEILWQGATAVVPTYRNRGLGRWLKAAMLEKVLADRPEVKHVRTDNAQSNDPMLKINRELGFNEVKAGKVWQIATEKVREKVREKVQGKVEHRIGE